MIVVLSLNTAVDRTLLVPGFEPGGVYRATRVHVGAGGKGLNVARVAHALGERVRVIGFLGGAVSGLIEHASNDLAGETVWISTAEESRTCMIVVDPESGRQTVVNEPGPRISAGETDAFWRTATEHAGPGDLVALPGSAPPGLPETLHRDLVLALQQKGAHVLVDATGETLRLALGARPWAAAPNEQECATALGPGEPITLVTRLAETTEHALLTRGKEGVLYGGSGGVWDVRPPAIQALNAVGSGDAFVGGFLAGMERGLAPLDAVKLAVACGAANTLRLEPGTADGQVLEEIQSAVAIEQIVSASA